MNKQSAIIGQKQTQKFSPQQVLVATMLQSTSEELENLIIAETEKNPALEVDDAPSMQSMEGDENSNSVLDENGMEEGQQAAREDNSLDEDQYRKENGEVDFFEYDDNSPSDNMGRNAEDAAWSPFANYASDVTSVEELHLQVQELELDEEEAFLANYIIDSLDDNGYMRRSMQDLCDDLEITQHYETTPDELERVLTDVVQNLDPVGIGARDLRECMLLQLQEMPGKPAVLRAYDIVDKHYDDVFRKSFDRIKNKLEITDKELAEALRVISHINPKPGGMMDSADRLESKASQIKPDFSIRNMDGELVVQLLDGHLSPVRISDDYQQMLNQWQSEKQLNQEEKKGANFLKDSIASASSFIDALQQRRITLLKVIKVIAALQKEYFLSGGNPDLLKPMVLQDVAERSGYDISTISRVSNSKYIDTDFGLLAVRELFSTGIANDEGELISNEAIKNALKVLIDEEDKKHPLADEALAKLLNEKGYPVARRTVAKYREALGLPTARMRKEL
ncbi:MAG: RNA polymerase factor sigma-54 [Bacteroidales bacterium]|nr:RNA polymerase factor sigma-54 [Bacteroidales bacterium]